MSKLYKESVERLNISIILDTRTMSNKSICLSTFTHKKFVTQLKINNGQIISYALGNMLDYKIDIIALYYYSDAIG